MDARHRAETIDRYRRRLREHGVGPQALGWTKGNQKARFDAALRGLGLSFGSVLDVGCGFGDLYDHLLARGWSGRYLGVDIVPEFIAVARERHVGQAAEFLELDPTSEPLGREAEVGVAIGLLNHDLAGEAEAYIEAMIRRLWQATSRLVAVDFLSTTANERRDELHHTDPGWALALGLRLTRRAQLDHSYMPFEFMLRLWHDETYSAAHPVFAEDR
jgi:SAM-dependent methyltransferase